MAHPEPKIQDLIETLQGVLVAFGARHPLWRVTETLAYYEVSCMLVGSNLTEEERQARYSQPFYWVRFCVSREMLHKDTLWGSIKWGVIRSILVDIGNKSTPAPEAGVHYATEPACKRGEAWK
jgi:hypothetical protein